MHTVKEKVSNAAAVAQERIEVMKAKAEEKAAKAAATTKEEKEIAYERRKAKEAEAKMKMHEAKAENAAEKLRAKYPEHHDPITRGQGHHEPVGTVLSTTSTMAPNYPLGGYPPVQNKNV